MHRKSVYFLVLAVAAMLVLGIVMLSSTSAFAQGGNGDQFSYVKRQSLWIGIGVLACLAGALMDYHFWQRTWAIWFGVAVVLLILCFIPHIGMKINGSWRWVRFGPINFQPSEVGKIAAIAFLAHWFSKYESQSGQLLKGFFFPMTVVAVLMGLIAREVDLGTTALIGGTMFLMMFVAGTNLLYIGTLALSGLAGLYFVATHMTERLGRITAFLNLEKYKDGAGLQQWQALIAFGSGGVEGLGLGNGRQKMLYVPFAHTDFIFPMIGEELGLRITLLVILCYLVMILCGTAIAMRARDRFGMLFGFGIIIIIALQAAVNIGVTTALLPNKGLPLPFISYGGSNLAFCLFGIGVLINIYRQGLSEKAEKATVKLRAKLTPRI